MYQTNEQIFLFVLQTPLSAFCNKKLTSSKLCSSLHFSRIDFPQDLFMRSHVFHCASPFRLSVPPAYARNHALVCAHIHIYSKKRVVHGADMDLPPQHITHSRKLLCMYITNVRYSITDMNHHPPPPTSMCLCVGEGGVGDVGATRDVRAADEFARKRSNAPLPKTILCVAFYMPIL